MFNLAYIESPLSDDFRKTVESDAKKRWENYLDPILQMFMTRFCAGPVGIMAYEWDRWSDGCFLAAFRQATSRKILPALTPEKAVSFAEWFVRPPAPDVPDRGREKGFGKVPEGLDWSHNRLSGLCYLTTLAVSDPTGKNLSTAFNMAAVLLKHLPRTTSSYPGFGQPLSYDDTDLNDGGEAPTRWASLMKYGLALNVMVILRKDAFTDLLKLPAVRTAWNEVESAWPTSSGVCSTASLLAFKLRASLFDAHCQRDRHTLTRLDDLLQESPEYAAGEDDAGEPEETSIGHLALAVDHTRELIGV